VLESPHRLIILPYATVGCYMLNTSKCLQTAVEFSNVFANMKLTEYDTDKNLFTRKRLNLKPCFTLSIY